MMDSGFPLTTEPNILKEIISPPNLVSKVLSVVTGGASNVSSSLPLATASDVPWRGSGIKHGHNEICFDLVEEMDAVVNRCLKVRMFVVDVCHRRCDEPKPLMGLGLHAEMVF